MRTVMLAIGLLALAPVAEAAPKKVLVQDLEARGVEPHEAATIGTAACNEVAKDKSLSVLCGDDLRAMIQWNAMAASFNACADEGCVAKTAKALEASLVVSGHVAKIGDEFVLAMSMLDVSAGRSVGRAEVKAAKIDALFRQVPEAVQAMLGPKKR